MAATAAIGWFRGRRYSGSHTAHPRLAAASGEVVGARARLYAARLAQEYPPCAS